MGWFITSEFPLAYRDQPPSDSQNVFPDPRDLFGQPIVDDEIVPDGFGHCLGSLGSCYISLGISG